MSKVCIRCGSKIKEDVNFCPHCGMSFSNKSSLDRQLENSAYQQSQKNFYQQSNTQEKKILGKKATSIVGYFGIFGLLIAFVLGDKKGARFHLNQSLVIHILFYIYYLIRWIYFTGISNMYLDSENAQISVMNIIIVDLILNIYFLVCWIIGFVGAIKQEEKKMPIVGKIKIL